MPDSTAAARPRRTRLSATDRRASILAAATEVFAETGYQRGKMSEVAKRVGVSEPVVFQNFGSKAAVFAAVLDHAAEQMAHQMRAWAEAMPTVGSWLTALLAPEHLTKVHASGQLGVLFADAMTLTAEPDIQDAARRANRSIAATLTDLLTDGQADGSIRPDLDPAAGAWWLMSLLASQGFRHSVAPDPARVEQGLGDLTRTLLLTPGPDPT